MRYIDGGGIGEGKKMENRHNVVVGYTMRYFNILGAFTALSVRCRDCGNIAKWKS